MPAREAAPQREGGGRPRSVWTFATLLHKFHSTRVSVPRAPAHSLESQTTCFQNDWGHCFIDSS